MLWKFIIILVIALLIEYLGDKWASRLEWENERDIVRFVSRILSAVIFLGCWLLMVLEKL